MDNDYIEIPQHIGEKKIDVANKETPFLHKLFMIVLIYLTDSLLFNFNSVSYMTTIAQALVVALAITSTFYCLFKNHFKINKGGFALLLVCIYVLLEMLVHNEIRGGYISKISVFLLGFSLISLLGTKKVASLYVDSIFFISLISIVVFPFQFFIARLSIFPIITNTAGRSFRCLLFTNVSTLDYLRNYGPFTEPSRFQAFICMGLVLLLFLPQEYLHKKNFVRIAVLILALVTTSSATGFIAVSIIITAYVISDRVSLSIGKRIVIILVVFVIVAVLIRFSTTFNDALLKIQLQEGSESFKVRMNSILGNLEIIKRHPLFGTGFDNYNEEYLLAIRGLSVSRSHVSTNTFLLNFAKFGIPVGLYYITNLYQSLRSYNSRLISIALLLGAFFAMSGISLVDSIIANMFIFMNSEKTEGILYRN